MRGSRLIRRVLDRVRPPAWRYLFLHYVDHLDQYWRRDQRQVDKLNERMETLCAAWDCSRADALERILEQVVERTEPAPHPVYITGLGASGSTWLNQLIGGLPGFAFAQEVYFPNPLVDRMALLAPREARLVIDALHLLHALPFDPTLTSERLVNNARGRILEYKDWNPGCFTIYLHRDPRDQVLSRVYRKPNYRERMGDVSEDVLLEKNIRENVTNYRKFLGLREHIDFVCSYEILRDDPRGVLREIASAMKHSVDDAAIDHVCEEFDRQRIRETERPVGSNLDAGGVSQGWRRDAAPELVERLQMELAESITGLGYTLELEDDE